MEDPKEPARPIPREKPSGNRHETEGTLLRFFLDRPFLNSFILTSLFLLAALAFFRAHFTFNDDIFSLLLLKGVGLTNVPSAWNLFENILLGTALKDLYTLFPRFQWYSLLLFFVQFLSFWALLAAFQLGPQRLFKASLFLFTQLAFNFYFFSKLQWTLAASLAAVAAFILWAALWRSSNPRFLYPALLLSSILLLFSCLIRPSALGLGTLACLPLVFFTVYKSDLTPPRRFLLRCSAVPVLLCGLAWGYNGCAYHADPDWARSTRLFELHNELLDFRNPVYDQGSKPVFDSIGWSRNDLDLFVGNYFLDADTYSPEKLEKLEDYFPKLTADKKHDPSEQGFFSYPSVRMALAFFAALLLFLPANAFRLALAAAAWIGLLVLFMYFYLKTPERVCFPPALCLVYLGIFFAVPPGKKGSGQTAAASWKKPTAWVLGLLLALATGYYLYREYGLNQRWNEFEGEFKTSLQELRPNDGQLYVAWGSSLPFEFMGAFDDFESYRHFNLVSLAWFQRSPTTAAMLKRFGVTHLFRDLVDNPDLFLICDRIQFQLYANYMRERYGMNVTGETVYQSPYSTFMGPFFTILRIRSTPPTARH